MNDKKLQILENLLAVVETKSSSQEMVKVFGVILEMFKKMKVANETERAEINALLKETIATLKSDSKLNFNNLKEDLLDRVSTRLAMVKDGKVGPRGERGEKGDSIVGPEGKVGKTGEKGDKGDKPDHKWNGTKLSFENPDGTWGKEVDLRGDRGNNYALFGGGSSGGGHVVKSYDLSSQLNGVLKTFSLPAFWRVILVQSSSFPNTFRPTTDYTTDGAAMTITFTSEIEAASTLATGQTLLVTYSEP